MVRGMLTCAVTGRVVTTETKKRTRASSEGKITYLTAWNPDNPKKKIYIREEEIIEQIEE